MEIDRPSFLYGFLLGFLLSGYLGWLLQKIRQTRSVMQAPDRPMSGNTPHTPRSVFAAAAAAFWRLLRWLFLLLLSLVIAGTLLYYLLLGEFS
jgi:hypothetical protein